MKANRSIAALCLCLSLPVSIFVSVAESVCPSLSRFSRPVTRVLTHYTPKSDINYILSFASPGLTTGALQMSLQSNKVLFRAQVFVLHTADKRVAVVSRRIRQLCMCRGLVVRQQDAVPGRELCRSNPAHEDELLDIVLLAEGALATPDVVDQIPQVGDR